MLRRAASGLEMVSIPKPQNAPQLCQSQLVRWWCVAVPRVAGVVGALVLAPVFWVGACSLPFSRFEGDLDASIDASADVRADAVGQAEASEAFGAGDSEWGEATTADACGGVQACVSQATTCGTSCGQTSQQCQNNCQNQPCRQACRQAEASCRTACDSACVACAAGCSATQSCQSASGAI
jgi:hypothetical protein